MGKEHETAPTHELVWGFKEGMQRAARYHSLGIRQAVGLYLLAALYCLDELDERWQRVVPKLRIDPDGSVSSYTWDPTYFTAFVAVNGVGAGR